MTQKYNIPLVHVRIVLNKEIVLDTLQ